MPEPNDPPEDKGTPAIDTSSFVSKDDLDASISDISEQIKSISSKMEEKAQPPAVGEKLPWEENPEWQPKNYNELFSIVEKYMENRGFTKAKVEEITSTVQDQLTEKQKKEREENDKVMAQARKRLDTEIEQIKKDNPDMDKDKVFEFIADWNKSHPSSRLNSFKDGYELYALKNPSKANDQQGSKPRLPGAPTSSEVEKENKIPRYKNVDDALAVALAKFEQE